MPEDNHISLHEAIQKIDNTLTRVPMKMQEEIEQLMETRMMIMNVIRTYESALQEKDRTITDLKTYSTGLEELLSKTEVKIELSRPQALTVNSPHVK